MIYKSLLKPLLFRFDAEKAHDITLSAAKKAENSSLLSSMVRTIYDYQSTLLSQNIWGHTFRNPVGLAAGFDKNGCIIKALENLGMGFTEIGSITAQARGGNPKPRAFRLPEDHALINRMGLNNDGAQTVVKRLKNSPHNIPVGINIAKTHDPEIMGNEAIDDYLFSYKEAQKVADYITINISCPNTTEGKTFEEPNVLDKLLATLLEDNKINAVPTLVKVSPDLKKDELIALIKVCEDHHIDGYVACNTSSSRLNLKTDSGKLEAVGNGGLSGVPLASKSIRTIGWIRETIGKGKPVIGVGGINSVDTALAMLKNGANLLQVYTGLVYEGPALVKNINRGLVKYVEENGLDSVKQI